MTAILDIDVLRTHAVSVIAPVDLGHAPESDWNRASATSRPSLMMRWRVMPDGRLTCRWQTDVSATFGPPPD